MKFPDPIVQEQYEYLKETYGQNAATAYLKVMEIEKARYLHIRPWRRRNAKR